MADRSHLTPVTTTDKRGRTTTVYRNLRESPAQSARSSLPKLTIPAAAPANEPIADRIMQEPSERGRAELAAFLGSIATQPDSQREQIEAILGHRDGRAAAALAMDYVEDGLLDPALAFGVLLLADAESPGGEPLDALPMTAFFQPRAAELDAGDPSEHEPWHQRVCWAVSGYRRSENCRFWDGPALTTREQFDAGASVIDFVLRFDTTPDSSVLHYALNYTKVANPALEGYLREGPYDPERIDRIAAYVTEHGMDRSDPGAVNRLRGWVEGGTGLALGNGWL